MIASDEPKHFLSHLSDHKEPLVTGESSNRRRPRAGTRNAVNLSDMEESPVAIDVVLSFDQIELVVSLDRTSGAYKLHQLKASIRAMGPSPL
jgi:hypothetical protein